MMKLSGMSSIAGPRTARLLICLRLGCERKAQGITYLIQGVAMRLIAMSLVLLLTGCATPEQIARQEQQRAYQQQQQAAQYRASLAAQCSGFGFQQGTAEFANCMMQLHQAEQQRRAAIGAAIIGSGILNQPQPKPYQIPPMQIPRQPTQTNCYTDRYGYTNCTTR